MPVGDLIFQRLELATEAELEAFARALSQEITLASFQVRKTQITRMSRLLRSEASSSFTDVFRGDHALEYESILRKVAEAAANEAGWTVPKIPNGITECRVEDYITKAFTFAAMRGTAKEPNTRMAQVHAEMEALGRTTPPPSGGWNAGLALLASKFIVGTNPALLTLGAAAAGIAWVTGPAMRRVIPAVLVLIHIRHRADAESQLSEAA